MAAAPVAIVAMADNGVIGRGGGLPWRLPEDLKRFKSLTMGQALLMGRRTQQSIGRALPGRRNLVLSRNPAWRASGCETVASPQAALALLDPSQTLYVIGGAQVYQACWGLVGRLELTEVHAEVPGDTRLEGFDRREWRETFREDHPADARHAHPYSFVTLERR
ncbi:MAG TPA: dihydrofolate reductase [Steroidobacteraceae bacterium]|nr:dihydrofolate reductase [Steroidobacteraceae bacterium]